MSVASGYCDPGVLTEVRLAPRDAASCVMRARSILEGQLRGCMGATIQERASVVLISRAIEELDLALASLGEKEGVEE